MLKDAQAAGAEGHEAEPLPAEVSFPVSHYRLAEWAGNVHDHEINEVD